MRLKSFKGERRGSILLFTVFFVFLSAGIILSLVTYTFEVHRLSEANIALEKATHTAEAGLHRLIHYFNHPEDLPANMAAQKQQVIDFFENERKPEYIDTDQFIVILKKGAHNASLIQFDNSEVVDLRALSPRANAHPDAMFTFESRAESTDRMGRIVQRTAIMDVRFDPGPRLVSPAAIVAGGGVSANGQFNMHWGEAWSKESVRLTLNRAKPEDGSLDENEYWGFSSDENQSNAANDDHAVYRSVKTIQDSGGDDLTNAHVNDVVSKCSDLASSNYIRDGEGILFQHEDDFTPVGEQTLTEKIDDLTANFDTLGNPDMGYEFWRQVAIRRDTYFRPNATGSELYDAYNRRLYIDNDKINANGVGTALTASAAMEWYRDEDDAFLVFFDTVDGNPPAADESNYCNLKMTGAISNSSQGLLYVAGSFEAGGSGTPPAQVVKDPDDVEHSLNVFHDGIVYTAKDFIYQGNPVLFGSVICKGNFDSGGTPNVYYNVKLKDGLEPQPLSTRARILAQLIQH